MNSETEYAEPSLRVSRRNDASEIPSIGAKIRRPWMGMSAIKKSVCVKNRTSVSDLEQDADDAF